MRLMTYEEFKKISMMENDCLDNGSIRDILDEVRKNGDQAIREFTRKFDRIDIRKFRVEDTEIKRAADHLARELRNAVTSSARRVRAFAQFQSQQVKDRTIEIESGVVCRQVINPIERIGVYVPGGRYPLISSVIMGVVPAQVAGVKEICICSPPDKNGKIAGSILGSAGILGIKEIYCIGGCQAIAAMAYGTETIRKVDKIVGPGNRYVTQAKKAVFGQVGIDFIAGPTEVMIIADDSADPELIAADLLAQAEHDVAAVPLLITTSRIFSRRVTEEITKQLTKLDTAKTAKSALENNGACIIVKNMEDAIHIANSHAPEHLELQVKDPDKYENKFKHFGSLFIGTYAAEVLGDYSCGLNHILPTGRAARYTAGLSIFDFIRLQTALQVDKKGFEKIASDAETLARAEGLSAHTEAVRRRRNK